MSTLFISPARSRQVLAAIVAFALVSVFVIRTSDAAFTADATNPGNQWSTVSISLNTTTEVPLFGDTDAGALENGLALVPGQVVTGCLNVDYAGDENLDAANIDNVFFDATGADGTLAQNLLVTIERFDECQGNSEATIATSTALSDIAGVSTGWQPSGDEDSRGFLFTITVDDLDEFSGQGLSVDDVNLTWSVSTTSS